MTWLEALRNAIRTFLITRETENVVTPLCWKKSET